MAVLAAGCTAFSRSSGSGLNPTGADEIDGALTSDGGVLMVGDDASITFPKAMVDERVAVDATVEPGATVPFHTVVRNLHVQHSADLGSGATVRFALEEKELDESLVVMVREDDGRWSGLPTKIDADSGVVSAQAPHFSEFVVVLPVPAWSGMDKSIQWAREQVDKFGNNIETEYKKVVADTKQYVTPVGPEAPPKCAPAQLRVTATASGPPQQKAFSVCAQGDADGVALKITNRYRVPYISALPLRDGWVAKVPAFSDADSVLDWLGQAALTKGSPGEGLTVGARGLDPDTGTFGSEEPPTSVLLAPNGSKADGEVTFIPDPLGFVINAVTYYVTFAAGSGGASAGPRGVSFGKYKKDVDIAIKEAAEAAATADLNRAARAGHPYDVKQALDHVDVLKADFERKFTGDDLYKGSVAAQRAMDWFDKVILAQALVFCAKAEWKSNGIRAAEVPEFVRRVGRECLLPISVYAAVNGLNGIKSVDAQRLGLGLVGSMITGLMRSAGIITSTLATTVARNGSPRVRMETYSAFPAGGHVRRLLVADAQCGSGPGQVRARVQPTVVGMTCGQPPEGPLVRDVRDLKWSVWEVGTPVGRGVDGDTNQPVTLTLFDPVSLGCCIQASFQYGLVEREGQPAYVQRFPVTTPGHKRQEEFVKRNAARLAELDCLSDAAVDRYQRDAVALGAACGIEDQAAAAKVLQAVSPPDVASQCTGGFTRGPSQIESCDDGYGGWDLTRIQWSEYESRVARGRGYGSDEGGPWALDYTTFEEAPVSITLADPVTHQGRRVFRAAVVVADPGTARLDGPLVLPLPVSPPEPGEDPNNAWRRVASGMTTTRGASCVSGDAAATTQRCGVTDAEGAALAAGWRDGRI